MHVQFVQPSKRIANIIVPEVNAPLNNTYTRTFTHKYLLSHAFTFYFERTQGLNSIVLDLISCRLKHSLTKKQGGEKNRKGEDEETKQFLLRGLEI